jgi:hypothetical protein
MADEPETNGDGEVRHLPVLTEAQEPRPIGPDPRQEIVQRPVTLPAAALAATGGVLAGIATCVRVQVLRRRRIPRAIARRRRGKGVEIAASRSFLVDVHLLKR